MTKPFGAIALKARGGAAVLADRIRREVRALSFTAGNKPVSVTVSVGASGSNKFEGREPSSQQELIEAADKALYAAKSNSRDRVELA